MFFSVSYLFLVGFLAAALFFGMTGYREARGRYVEGLLYIALSIFFVFAHIYCLINESVGNPVGIAISGLNFWTWLAVIFAPALIALYLVIGLIDFIRSHIQSAMVKLFFGLTLLCFIYMLGHSWPADVKAILTVFYCITWFNVEYITAQ